MGFFTAQPLLLARLQDQVPDVTNWLVYSEFIGQEDIAGLAPLGVIRPGKGAASERFGIEKTHCEVQTWLVGIAVKNQVGTESGVYTEDVAGPYLQAVFDALDGWKPATGSVYNGFMLYESRLDPEYAETYTLFSLEFSLTVNF